MANIIINTVFNINVEFESAPINRRIVAYLIDFFILAAYLTVGKLILYDVLNLNKTASVGFDMLVVTLPMLFYSLVCENALNGQTIGKKVMGIRVISMEGGEPTFGQFLLRWITKFFEWPFLFGYVYGGGIAIFMYALITGFLGVFVLMIIALTKFNQRIGDVIGRTVVVNASTRMSVEDTVFKEISSTNTYKVTFSDVMRLSDNDINTIKTVLLEAKKGNYELAKRVEAKVKEVLDIESNLYTMDFLEKLLEDYNYLATKEAK